MAFSITSTWLCQAIVIGTTSRCVNCFRSKVLFIFIIRCSVRGTFEMWANGIFIARCLASQFSVMQQASNSIFFACCTSANSDFHTQFWCWWWWQRYMLSATDVTANGDSSAGGYDGIKPKFCIFGNCCHNASRCDHKRNGPKIKRKPMTSETIENYDCVRRNIAGLTFSNRDGGDDDDDEWLKRERKNRLWWCYEQSWTAGATHLRFTLQKLILDFDCCYCCCCQHESLQFICQQTIDHSEVF